MQTTDQFVTRMFETNPDFLFTVTRRASARRRNGIRSTTTSFACTPRIPCRISLPAPAIPCRADDLNGNQGDQDEQQNRASSPDKDARNHQPAKHVNRIANARVEAGGYQFGRPGLNAKSSPKLNPRKRQQKQRWSGDRHPNDLPQSPRLRCGIAAKYDCARGKKDKCDDIELHGSIARRRRRSSRYERVDRCRTWSGVEKCAHVCELGVGNDLLRVRRHLRAWVSNSTNKRRERQRVRPESRTSDWRPLTFAAMALEAAFAYEQLSSGVRVSSRR